MLMSILMSYMKVIEIGQKYFLWTFWGFKINVNVCKPHYVHFFNFQVFRCLDNLTSFDISIHYLNHLSLSQLGLRWGSMGICDMKPMYVCSLIMHKSSVFHTPVPYTPCTPLAPVPHCPCTPHPCTPYTMYPIAPCSPLSMFPIVHVVHTPVPIPPCSLLPLLPYCPCAPLSMCPIPLVSPTPCSLLPLVTLLPMYPIANKPHHPVPI